MFQVIKEAAVGVLGFEDGLELGEGALLGTASDPELGLADIAALVLLESYLVAFWPWSVLSTPRRGDVWATDPCLIQLVPPRRGMRVRR